MVNTQSYGALARSRPRAFGLVASALLLVTSVDYATAAGPVSPGSDHEDVSGTFTRIDGAADDEPLTIKLIDAIDAELDGPGELSFVRNPFIWPPSLVATEENGIVSALVMRFGGSDPGGSRSAPVIKSL